MNIYQNMSREDLVKHRQDLQQRYDSYLKKGLSLDMSRGKPSSAQLDISMNMYNNFKYSSKIEYRNYGIIDGIKEAKSLFAELMEVSEEEIIVGGNSSLNMMYDSITRAMLFGLVDSTKPWSKYEKIKFLCPSPGYDRHFAICEQLGIEMITIDLNSDGPDMDTIEKLVSEDETIKGIWCIPKYSNPTGISYSDEVVKRFAQMHTAAKDFRIFWDNAYIVHHLTDEPDKIINLLDECKKAGNSNRTFMFSSTSKITFPGSGIAAMAASKENIDHTKKIISMQTIGPNKMNQLMHVNFFKNLDGILLHMKKHAEILKPKFDTVISTLEDELGDKNIATWTTPNGGYFISLDVLEGCAIKVVKLASELGVKLTPAGATYPYKKDPYDKNIRIAPTFPPINELEEAIHILCLCVEIASVDKVLKVK